MHGERDLFAETHTENCSDNPAEDPPFTLPAPVCIDSFSPGHIEDGFIISGRNYHTLDTDFLVPYPVHSQGSSRTQSAAENKFSTAYVGATLTQLRPIPFIAKIYLPNESTAFTGMRGGYQYQGKPLHTTHIEQNDILISEHSPANPTAKLQTVERNKYVSAGLLHNRASHRHYTSAIKYGTILMISLLLTLGSYCLFFPRTQSPQPADIVRAYFLALSQNHAEAALDFARMQPQDTRFLNSATLGLQNSLAILKLQKITAVTFQAQNRAVVEFNLGIGNTRQFGKILTEKYQGKWFLNTAAIPISRENIIHSTDDFGPELLTIDGKPIAPISDITYFFPGMHAIALTDSPNPALQLYESHFLLAPNFSGMNFPQIGMHIAQTTFKHRIPLPIIRQADRAVLQTFRHCSSSQIFQKSHCPFPIPIHLVLRHSTNTIHWGLPLSAAGGKLLLHYSSEPIDNNQFISYIRVKGKVKLPWTIGNPIKNAVEHSGTIIMHIDGKVHILGINKYVFSFN